MWASGKSGDLKTKQINKTNKQNLRKAEIGGLGLEVTVRAEYKQGCFV